MQISKRPLAWFHPSQATKARTLEVGRHTPGGVGGHPETLRVALPRVDSGRPGDPEELGLQFSPLLSKAQM